jgi:hypothetical protein
MENLYEELGFRLSLVHDHGPLLFKFIGDLQFTESSHDFDSILEREHDS